MKKLFLTLALTIAAVVATNAQSGNEILEKYYKATNVSKLSSGVEGSFMIDMAVKANQGGMNIEMPIKMIQQNPGNKIRMEMEMMGQKVLIVSNGTKGWIQMAGQVQEVPAEQLAQMTSQGNIVENLKWDESKFTNEYVGEKDGIKIVKIIAKDPNAQMKEMSLGFNAKSGLLEWTEGTTQGMTVKTVLSDYKEFDGVSLPTAISVSMGGQEISVVNIKDLELDYPTAEFMFVEPK
ncbi:hypothetical protein BN938_1977 [Mucinivorans hirudinis]|uniref:Outer membrane lipoprotein-sorting protein n=1 Tax=Mucinivorans hirudinis TaxID=1433126 RepID=A0A060RDR5_9BACT|nr:hypothetical protein BN938_1977 [Mucinivorans hirudinis]